VKTLLVVTVALVFTPCAAWALDDAGSDVLDASVVDGSVGQGGADQNTQENQDSTGTVQTVCNNTGDCDRGFECQANRCTYTGYKKAGSGCALGADAALLTVGLGLAFRRRAARKH
jgi:hypothetical protein